MFRKLIEKKTSVEQPTAKYYNSVDERPYDHPMILAFARPKIEWIFRNISLSHPSILEVGAGNGYFSFHLMQRGQLTATDISDHQLQFNPAPTRELCSVYHLPYPDNTFDLVIGSNLLHHLDDPELAVKEMVRVSKNYVVVSEPNNVNPILFIGSLLIPAERKAALFSRTHVTKLLSRDLDILKHTYQGGILLPNRTPGFLFKYSRPESCSRYSFFQIFICAKRV
jgi:SAM-dependent methyltransferase